MLEQPLGTLSGGQRRRVELARILFSGAETLLLDEPTNHLDADSIVWLRDFLKPHRGGLIVISHDVDLLEATVNRVFHLDANRCVIDVYNVGLEGLPHPARDRRASPQARARQRREAGRTSCSDQADRMRATATKAKAAQNMARRAERLLGGLEETRRTDKVAKLRFPTPAPCGKTPLRAQELSKSYGSLEIFTDVDLAIDKGSRVVVLGLNGAGKTTLLRILAGVDQPDTGRGPARPRAAARLLRAGARDARPGAHGAGEHALGRAGPARAGDAQGARVVPVLRRRRRTSPPARCPAARRRASRSRRSWCPPPTCCCSTSPPTTSTRPAARRSSARCAPTRARSSS